MRYFLLFLCVFVVHSPVWGLVLLSPTHFPVQTTSPEKDGVRALDSQLFFGNLVRNINVEGVSRTKLSALKRLIVVKPGTSLTEQALSDTLQNFHNAQVFYSVTPEFTPIYPDPLDATDSQHRPYKIVDITFKVEEKWTLVPYAFAGFGGSAFSYGMGLADTNFLGRLYTLNTTVGCVNQNCSYMLYFQNPALWGKNFLWGLNASDLEIVYTVYKYHDNPDTVEGNFLYHNRMVESYVDLPPVAGHFKMGAGVVYQHIDAESKGLDESQTQANADNNFLMPTPVHSLALEGRATLGQLNYSNITIDGAQWQTVIQSTGQTANPQGDYSSIGSNLLWFYTPDENDFFGSFLPRHSYYAEHFNFSETSAEVLSEKYFIGGSAFGQLRGFEATQFYGSVAWYDNLEMRAPVYEGNEFAWQVVPFFDMGNAGETFYQSTSGSQWAVSFGGGVRLLPIKINRLALRADFAYTISPFHTYGVNFGLLQFF